MKNITRTIYGAYVQSCQYLGLPFVLSKNTTLNELLNIQPGVGLATAQQTPTQGYYAIGNGGHTMSLGSNGLTKVTPIQHSGTDAGLYSQIPFILRPIANDLSVTDQVKYALRRIEVINGAQYVAYYLKRIDFTGVVPGMENIVVANGNETVTPFVPNSGNLNPSPPALNSSGVNIVTGAYVAASTAIALTLTAAEIAELINVATVKYGDPGFAIISEIALCSGQDKIVQSPGAANTLINFNEAVCVQVGSFINTFDALEFNNSSWQLSLDLGATEPLFALS